MSDFQYNLGHWLERFLLEHVVTVRNLARNTQKSYRDAFILFLPFLSEKLGKPVEQLEVRDISSELVLQFLAYLENVRGCSVATRNQRLTAIRAFARYLASRDPTLVAWSGHIRAIPQKKGVTQPVSYLSKDEMSALLKVPNRKKLRGRIEYALLQFLYNTGARVSEATQLQVGDLQTGRGNGRHALATLHGKGGKTRRCPLVRQTEQALKSLVQNREPTEYVFLNRYEQPYTRHGVYRIVRRCASKVPALADKKITPHMLRHTAACHLLKSGVDINTIRQWLGHAHLSTTNIYAEIDLETKEQAVSLLDVANSQPSRPWKADKGLMARLASL
ncbi:MAG: tyrosine-type recombinase/integrase [Gammaproteobacteria bacterium]|nr:tyrosine-type recombinase/integrase [Gammaproteobacteria bacterium]MYE49764.1 tyrosine-type recombinase/integrase [Gammaproteobacteria bacterium]